MRMHLAYSRSGAVDFLSWGRIRTQSVNCASRVNSFVYSTLQHQISLAANLKLNTMDLQQQQMSQENHEKEELLTKLIEEQSKLGDELPYTSKLLAEGKWGGNAAKGQANTSKQHHVPNNSTRNEQLNKWHQFCQNGEFETCHKSKPDLPTNMITDNAKYDCKLNKLNMISGIR